MMKKQKRNNEDNRGVAIYLSLIHISTKRIVLFTKESEKSAWLTKSSPAKIWDSAIRKLSDNTC